MQKKNMTPWRNDIDITIFEICDNYVSDKQKYSSSVNCLLYNPPNVLCTTTLHFAWFDQLCFIPAVDDLIKSDPLIKFSKRENTTITILPWRIQTFEETSSIIRPIQKKPNNVFIWMRWELLRASNYDALDRCTDAEKINTSIFVILFLESFWVSPHQFTIA